MANLSSSIVEAESIASNFKAKRQATVSGATGAGHANGSPRDGASRPAGPALDAARAVGAEGGARAQLPRAASELRPHLLERAERAAARAAQRRHRHPHRRARLPAHARRAEPDGCT